MSPRSHPYPTLCLRSRVHPLPRHIALITRLLSTCQFAPSPIASFSPLGIVALCLGQERDSFLLCKPSNLCTLVRVPSPLLFTTYRVGLATGWNVFKPPITC